MVSTHYSWAASLSAQLEGPEEPQALTRVCPPSLVWPEEQVFNHLSFCSRQSIPHHPLPPEQGIRGIYLDKYLIQVETHGMARQKAEAVGNPRHWKNPVGGIKQTCE